MLRVLNLSKKYLSYGRSFQAVQDVSLEVPAGKIFTLLGPSGCGKTTTLRCIAGLEKPDKGEIELGDVVLYSAQKQVFIPPHRRGIGMVFQSYAIWPHMNVFENAAFPLRTGVRKFTKKELEEKVLSALEVVQLGDFAFQDANKLSGGQQQRLALARAIVMEPRLLLLDEPLSNLDAKLREKMRFELKRLQKELHITTVYVTHDQSEALSLSDLVAVMKNGQIEQIAQPKEIYDRPQSEFVADFIGNTNIVKGRITESLGNAGYYKVITALGELSANSSHLLPIGTSVHVSIRPENIYLSRKPLGKDNIWRGKLVASIFLGEFQDVQLAISEQLLQVRAHPSFALTEGEELYLEWDKEKCLALP